MPAQEYIHSNQCSTLLMIIFAGGVIEVFFNEATNLNISLTACKMFFKHHFPLSIFRCSVHVKNTWGK